MGKGTKISLITVTIVMLLAIVGGGIYVIEYSLGHLYPINMSYEDRLAHVINGNSGIGPWIDNLAQDDLIHNALVAMRDGEQHYVAFVYTPQPTRKAAIVLRGYHDSYTGMVQIAHIYVRMGYNILLPDRHMHGRSEDEIIQIEWKERHDMLCWMAIVDSLFSDSTGHSEQVVRSTSMGAALTMCVSDEDTPGYVKYFVGDYDYANVWDKFRNELKTQSGLPPFPLLYTTNALNELLCEWSFGEALPSKQVAKCQRSMLFIHRNRDIYVRTGMVYPFYKTKSQLKQLWVAKGSKRAENYKDHRQEYTEVVGKFISRHIP